MPDNKASDQSKQDDEVSKASDESDNVEGSDSGQVMPDEDARIETREAVDASTPAPTDDDGNALIDPGTTPPTVGTGPGEAGRQIP